MGFLKGIKTEIRISLVAEIDDDIGKTIKVPFVVTYRKLPVKEAQAIIDRAAAGEVTDEEIMAEHVLGWHMPGEGGDVDFTPDNLAAAMQELGYRNALVTGFSQAQFGRKAALQKN